MINKLKSEDNLVDIVRTIPFAHGLGLEAMRDETGIVTILRFREENIGNTTIRAIHGGAIGTLLEQAAFLHLIDQTDPQMVPKIINISIDYLRPAMAESVFARAHLIKQGRRICNVRIEAWQAYEEHLVAAANAHFLIS